MRKILLAATAVAALASTAQAAGPTQYDRLAAAIQVYSERCGFVDQDIKMLAEGMGTAYGIQAVKAELLNTTQQLKTRGMSQAQVDVTLCKTLKPTIDELNAARK